MVVAVNISNGPIMSLSDYHRHSGQIGWCGRSSVRKSDERTLGGATQRPALICKTIETAVTENEMVEQPDTQSVSSFPQPCGERPILRTRCGTLGPMSVLCDVTSYVESLQTDASAPSWVVWVPQCISAHTEEPGRLLVLSLERETRRRDHA